MTNRPLLLDTSRLANPDVAAELDAVLGSLPMSFRRTDNDETADVIVVGGPGWAERAAELAGSATAPNGSGASGVRGILVADPWPADHTSATAIGSLACPVVIDTGWRHNPAVDLIGEGVARFRGPGALLEARCTLGPGSDLGRAAVGMLDLVTALGTEPTELFAVRQDDRHLVLDGRLADHTAVLVTILASNANPSGATLWIGGADGRAELTLPDPSTAAAATATVTDASGHTALPVGNESAHRGALRRLAAAVADGTEPPDDARRFGSYTPLLLQAIGHPAGSPNSDRNSNDRGAA